MTKLSTFNSLQDAANAIRFLSVDAIVKAQEGHQGVPLGMAEIATVLYLRHLKHDPANPQWWDRDRVVLSNGHGSMLLYSVLYLSGYKRISIDEIKRFRELHSHCAGHPEYDPQAGIEVTTGQLGQGIANAMGMALAEAYLRAKLGSDITDHYTYAFVGDGCLQEGVGQEMISLAGHLKLGRLILLWDDNAITDDGDTAISISEDVPQRFRNAGWHVQQIDGHDIDAVDQAIAAAKRDARPSLIACKTIIAKGIARLQGQRGGHSARLFDDDAQAMRELLDWNAPSFEIPQRVLNTWRIAGKSASQAHTEWQSRIDELTGKSKSLFERIRQGKLPSHLGSLLLETKKQLNAAHAQGGINLSAAITDALTDALPERVVCCADLEAPTGHKKRLAAFTAQDNAGAYVHCGVREHLMAGMVVGMAAHGGIIPVSVTYLAFSDYMRPAMRMAALMGLPSLFVFSHDSIGIGKNGPTHQPVEILASLRAMPNMLVMRPADAAEAVECWQVALAHRNGPVSLIFSRQALPSIRSASSLSENKSERGAYVVLEGSKPVRQVTLLATGSEVAIAVEAREQLEKADVSCAVVSMPCWELFELQDESYRIQVLGSSNVRIGIEAAIEQGWERYLNHSNSFIGMKGYGLSGPADTLYKHFGITASAVVECAMQRLGQSLTQKLTQ